MVGIAAAAVVITVISAILMLPVKLSTEFAGKSVKLNVKIAFVTVYKSGKKSVAQKKNGTKDVKNEKEHFEKNMGSFVEKIKAYSDLCKTAVRLTKKYVTVKNTHLSILIGTGDAALTAVAVGAMWAAVSGAMAVLGSVCSLEKPKTDITPDYNKPAFKACGGCIILTRIVYIIIIAFEVKRKLNPKKGKEE